MIYQSEVLWGEGSGDKGGRTYALPCFEQTYKKCSSFDFIIYWLNAYKIFFKQVTNLTKESFSALSKVMKAFNEQCQELLKY